MRTSSFSIHGTVILIFSGLWAPGLSAQEVDLFSFGTFSTAGPNIIGGSDSYVVDCDEREYLCTDNFGNMWQFGENLADYRIRMCEQSFDVVGRNCVHTVQVNLKLSQPYARSILQVQRPNCALQEFFIDGDFLGSYGLDASGIGIRTNVEFSMGMLPPGKPHTLLITAPESDDGKCAPPIQVITITGLSIRGVPLSSM